MTFNFPKIFKKKKVLHFAMVREGDVDAKVLASALVDTPIRIIIVNRLPPDMSIAFMNIEI